MDIFTIRRLDTGAAVATPAANEAWLCECRKQSGHVSGDAAARQASIAEARRLLADVFSR